ncbi:hypothetical protein [Archangium primigenium]|uniref:hypothetical protein n=1 Tax=[Archangium] primigenium TaxID=2792470 RepID=UPI001EF94057|nr:hypothetical protein [Archangium primigenium]
MKYFNNARDFSQRAEYEGRIVAALDEAHGHTRQVLGEAREAPVDVVLYTREEFRTHQGAALARTVAGLYSAGAIRINDAAELTRQTKATLVHEYVHAVVDDLVQAARGGQHVPVWLNEGLAEYVEWRYLGHDKPPVQMANRLRGAPPRPTSCPPWSRCPASPSSPWGIRGWRTRPRPWPCGS